MPPVAVLCTDIQIKKTVLSDLSMYVQCMRYSVYSHTGSGFQLVEATGVIVMGYSSID